MLLNQVAAGFKQSDQQNTAVCLELKMKQPQVEATLTFLQCRVVHGLH